MNAIARRGCKDTVREPALESNESGSKIPCPVGELNPRQYCAWLFSRTLYQLSYRAHLHCVCVCVYVCVCVHVCVCAHVCVCVCVCEHVCVSLMPSNQLCFVCVFWVPIQQNIPDDNKHNNPHPKLPPHPRRKNKHKKQHTHTETHTQQQQTNTTTATN